ncbi:MAG: c-type cytochrome biogenesis protein CcmI [Pseudomonadota bacterium]
MTGFLFIAGALSLLSILAIVAPLWRSREGVEESDVDIAIYKDQLAEVDRDLSRGVLNADEAERTRTEISRRLLAADSERRSQGALAPRGITRAMAIGLAVVLAGGAAGLYWSYGAPGYGDVPRDMRIAVAEERRANRPAQLEAEAAFTIPPTIDQFDEDTQSLIRTRRAAAFETPTDIATWRVLARTEAAIGQYQRALRAQEQVVALSGANVSEDDLVLLLDLMVAATNSYVSPEAEAVALAMLQDNANNIAALYYAGLLYAQNDRPDRAFGLWRRVVEDGGPGSLHYDFAVRQIEQVAAQLGVDYVVPERAGPTADDIAAAQDLPQQDRAAMIGAMVSSLSDRLATEGGPPQDWAQLITSLAVLGEDDRARAILNEALTVFGGDVQAVNIIRRAASEAGLDDE